MGTLKLRWIAGLAVCFWFALPFGAAAQAVEDYVRVAPPPDWVVAVKPPMLDADWAEGRERNTALIDYQNRHTGETDVYYSRVVIDLLTSAAVEDEGTLTIDFNPDFRNVTLHHVRLIRDGRVIDALDLSEAMVFRTETDRNQMIFNGSLTLSMPVLGMRVGDRLDYAYTEAGRNPAIGNGFLIRRGFDFSTDVQRLHYRIGVPEDLPRSVKVINDPPEPEIMTVDGYSVYQWDQPDPSVLDYDNDIPPWTYRGPFYEISSMESWADVGALFADYYMITDKDRAVLAPIVSRIEAEHDTLQDRTRAALDWVQTNIRYVALNMGEGGFVPRRPERILKRRFGDCKDVTILLLGLLDGLGVEAAPVLVDTKERGGEFDGLPDPYAFDHVIVAATLDGQVYPMDATRDPQLGTLETMEKVDERRGLKLVPGASEVIDLPQSDYPFRERMTDRFDLTQNDRIPYTFTMEEYGEDADGTASWLASSGKEDIESSILEYLQDIYPTITLSEPVTIDIDTDAAKSTVSLKTTLARDEDRTTLSSRAYQILSAMPDFEGGRRTLPLSIPHHRDTIHVREYVVGDTSDFNSRKRTVETDAFTFSYSDLMDGDVFREDYRWTSKRDFMAAETFEADMKSVRKIRGWLYSDITLPDLSGDVSGYSGVQHWSKWLVMVLALAFVVFTGWSVFRAEGRR